MASHRGGRRHPWRVRLDLWQKGRPFAPGDVFRASRFSQGSQLFPTQVLISPTSVIQYTPRWIGDRKNPFTSPTSRR